MPKNSDHIRCFCKYFCHQAFWDYFRNLAKLTAYLGVRMKMNDAALMSVVLTLVQNISQPPTRSLHKHLCLFWQNSFLKIIFHYTTIKKINIFQGLFFNFQIHNHQKFKLYLFFRSLYQYLDHIFLSVLSVRSFFLWYGQVLRWGWE